MTRLLLTVFCLVFFSQAVSAHGGVAIEDDKCILKAGPYIMHFTGFQPEQSQSEEFCEDIPNVGSAIIVLDYIDKPLRDMGVDFRIIEDVNNIGNTATIDDLGGAGDIEKNTVYYLPSQLRRTGSFNVEYNFTEPGRFIGMVTVDDIPNGQVYTSVFPFGVGYGLGATGFNPGRMWFTLLLVSAAVVMLYTIKKQEKERKEKQVVS
ncbi:MAG: hypothetical protein OXI88_18175 [Gammaproteobacteria bacterium]|nr:hypothetical protein [Gammaproteobacteria bacterium]MDE0513698.1 hypothetical protein [Gammaproteobacteria bacterium]